MIYYVWYYIFLCIDRCLGHVTWEGLWLDDGSARAAAAPLTTVIRISHWFLPCGLGGEAREGGPGPGLAGELEPARPGFQPAQQRG